MTITNLDVTALFPFPGELAARPVEVGSAPASTSAVSGPTSTPPSAKEPARTAEPSAELLTEHLHTINAGLKSFGIEFELSDIDNRLITRVVDAESGELIRQIPSEEVLRIARSLTETTGLLLQTTA